jgi:hypothetical protein
MAKHLSTISGRVLQSMNEPSVHVGAFKCKEKTLACFYKHDGGHPRYASSCIGTDVVLHGSSNTNDQREIIHDASSSLNINVCKYPKS